MFNYTNPLTRQREVRKRVKWIIATLSNRRATRTRRESGRNAPPPLALIGGAPNKLDVRIYNTNRGHLIPLELGGAEDPKNIVPMWGRFNKVGAWKTVEDKIKKSADDSNINNPLKIQIYCIYSNVHIPAQSCR